MAKKKTDEPGAKPREGITLQSIQRQLSRIQVSGLRLSEFPPPPESKAARGALAANGATSALFGLGAAGIGLLHLNAFFLSLAFSFIGIGLAGALYCQPDIGLARKPMAGHPSTQDGETRTVWETALTLTAVVGLTNMAIGTVVSSVLWMWVNRWLALAVVLGLNVLAAWIGYIGDGENRRSLEAVLAEAEAQAQAAAASAAATPPEGPQA